MDINPFPLSHYFTINYFTNIWKVYIAHDLKSGPSVLGILILNDKFDSKSDFRLKLCYIEKNASLPLPVVFKHSWMKNCFPEYHSSLSKIIRFHMFFPVGHRRQRNENKRFSLNTFFSISCDVAKIAFVVLLFPFVEYWVE